MDESVSIRSQFNGPPGSGNGGYVCGLLGKHFGDAPAEVTLFVPPPLERPLRLLRDGEHLALMDGEQKVAEAKPAALQLEAPGPPTLAVAEEAVQRYRGFHTHSFPSCFVCGPDRAEGDGLRIFSGWVPGSDVLAAPWTPGLQFAQADGTVDPAICWAALDCPGAFAIYHATGDAAPTIVLGRMTGRVLASARAGAPHVVISWPLGHEGRKHHAGTAIYTEDHQLLACSRQTWITIKS
ncbi:MAG: hypothetical protein HYV27_15520 [Candidatus Hydrogenedentes bacterium]|nr:hypothetical protein [Candidatus Hydrogenedentota bacterium]